ncbi:DUF2092 domain-containing protein [Anatilimnocola floriformis]|uniref:DUF2092 domain-containing protein n=1 Tax=Anatilimnocola floriformis TaxID=2948575 RepID=UPI0020C33EE0|nr:DUF2092 domain-containing protein [Anatilimnocola floriformis]
MRLVLSLACAGVSACLFATSVLGQGQPAPQNPAAPQGQPAYSQQQASADQAKFDEVLAECVKFLKTAPNYKLEVTNDWKTARGAEGQNHYKMTHARPNLYRIEVQSGFSKTPDLICANDGTQVTTLHDAQQLYSQHPAAEEGELTHNVMLAQSLAGSGIEILMQPNLLDFIHAHATSVKYIGLEMLDNARCHHFHTQWGQQQVELWIGAQGAPLLKQFSRTTQVNIAADNQFQMVATSKLNWKIGGTIPEGTFQISLPQDARRVHCIYEALSCDEAVDLVGQPVPAIELVQLDGSRMKLKPAEDKLATVLIFWASWCTPSTAEMPKVTGFVKDTASQGVQFYAVNVGEDVSLVRRFATKHEFTSAAVCDPAGAVSHAFRLGELPAVVIIDRQGKIRSVMHGAAKDLQANVTRELQAIAASPVLAPTRPPVTGLKQ